MKINTITITAEASKSYQKFCVAITAENLEAGDMEKLKNITISEATKGIDALVSSTGVSSNEPAKVETKEEYTPAQYKVTPQKQSKQGVESIWHNGVKYDKKFSKKNNQFFYVISDENLIDPAHPKYIQC